MLNINTDILMNSFSGNIHFDEATPDALRIIAPFFHTDGDMYDIFLRCNESKLILCDYGTTLMRLSYKTDLDTDNKRKVFSQIVADNCIANDGGNLVMETSYDTFFPDLMQYQIAISKVSNLDVLRREVTASLFLEQLSAFFREQLDKKYSSIQTAYKPTGESGFEVDYAILDNKDHPVYLMGIKDSISALRATALCLRVANLGIKHTSIAVHENPGNIVNRDRDALTNAVDKQFTSLEDFKTMGEAFIDRQIA